MDPPRHPPPPRIGVVLLLLQITTTGGVTAEWSAVVRKVTGAITNTSGAKDVEVRPHSDAGGILFHFPIRTYDFINMFLTVVTTICHLQKTHMICFHSVLLLSNEKDDEGRREDRDMRNYLDATAPEWECLEVKILREHIQRDAECLRY